MFNSNLKKSRTSIFDEDGTNPMENIANLADVMLVFACGLMIAIVLNWNVDLDSKVDIIDKSELVEIENIDEKTKQNMLSDEFKSMGRVVEDPKTGKVYIISN